MSVTLLLLGYKENTMRDYNSEWLLSQFNSLSIPIYRENGTKIKQRSEENKIQKLCLKSMSDHCNVRNADFGSFLQVA